MGIRIIFKDQNRTVVQLSGNQNLVIREPVFLEVPDGTSVRNSQDILHITAVHDFCQSIIHAVNEFLPSFSSIGLKEGVIFLQRGIQILRLSVQLSKVPFLQAFFRS